MLEAVSRNRGLNNTDPFGLCPPEDKNVETCATVTYRRDRASNSSSLAGKVGNSVMAGFANLGEQINATLHGKSTGDCGTKYACGTPLPVEGPAAEEEGLTYLYQKVSAEGEHLKFGITNNPATRYTQKELAGGRLRILARGARSAMLGLERALHENLPIGPEEGQSFYVEKQIQNGLRPPPYHQ